ncbi:unnamed protein product, partial [Amoebophrya sp. A25]
ADVERQHAALRRAEEEEALVDTFTLLLQQNDPELEFSRAPSITRARLLWRYRSGPSDKWLPLSLYLQKRRPRHTARGRRFFRANVRNSDAFLKLEPDAEEWSPTLFVGYSSVECTSTPSTHVAAAEPMRAPLDHGGTDRGSATSSTGADCATNRRVTFSVFTRDDGCREHICASDPYRILLGVPMESERTLEQVVAYLRSLWSVEKAQHPTAIYEKIVHHGRDRLVFRALRELDERVYQRCGLRLTASRRTGYLRNIFRIVGSNKTVLHRVASPTPRHEASLVVSLSKYGGSGVQMPMFECDLPDFLVVYHFREYDGGKACCDYAEQQSRNSLRGVWIIPRIELDYWFRDG